MKKAVFLDRDGVINKVCYHDEKGIYSAMSLEEFEVLPDVKESIKKLKENGFLVIVVTNQPGVAFGYLKKEEVKKIDEFMIKELKIDQAYDCFHHPEHTGECDCRKPKDGMIIKASKDFDINIEESFIVGDNLTDIKAGEKCKASFLILKKKTVDIFNLIEDMNIHPTHIVDSLKKAVEIILPNENSNQEEI